MVVDGEVVARKAATDAPLASLNGPDQFPVEDRVVALLRERLQDE